MIARRGRAAPSREQAEPSAIGRFRRKPLEVDPAMVLQVHRSTLVNVNAIAGGTRDFRGHLRPTLNNSRETLPVSGPYAHLFRQM